MSKALHAEADLTGDALADVAEAALAQGDLVEALALFHAAEPTVQDADRCAGGRWMAYMLLGDFAAAWRESDAIRQRGRPDPHRFWNGEELHGKRLMLRSLHGFGDAVQMFRFLPQLRSLAHELIVEVPPRLVELAPYFTGMGRVITWGAEAPAISPPWDVQMEVMELPYALRVTTTALEPRQGYLRLPESIQSRVQQVMGRSKMPRVGVVWCAGHWNPSRSISFDVFQSLLSVAGVEFWSLQGDGEGHCWATAGQDNARRDVYEVGDGILPLAGVIEQLDLVITVDTLAAHLAGALGVPCWVLLQRQADWRWMVQCEDSPWYPGLRLWRQQVQGDWVGLLQRVRAALQLWLASPKAQSRPDAGLLA
jgi:hypothetical protein